MSRLVVLVQNKGRGQAEIPKSPRILNEWVPLVVQDHSFSRLSFRDFRGLEKVGLAKRRD